MVAKLTELSAFLSIAEHLSFRRAASVRGTSTSALSHALRGLETELGVRLLNRTTRSVSLTEAGMMLYGRLRPAFAAIDQAVDAVNTFRDSPYGTVRLNAPRSVALSLLGPVMGALVRDNPGLSIEVSSDDRLVDIVAEGFDAGIRFGESIAKDMIAVRIGLELDFAVVGSPAYFAGRIQPATPADLHGHRCVRYRFPSGEAFPWEFSKDGQDVKVLVDGPITLDDQDLMIEAALNGVGLAFVFADRAAPYLADGRLVRCLADWCPSIGGLFLYYPDRAFMPAGLRALIEMLKRPPRRADPLAGQVER